MDIGEAIATGSPWVLGGAFLSWLLSLGIFARQADLAKLETKLYKDFMPRSETEQKINKIEQGVEKLLELFYTERG